MSELDKIRELITDRTKTALAASVVYSPVKMFYPNQPFEQPKNTLWAKLSIIGGEGLQASLGYNPTERHVGILQFDVIFPEDKGTKIGNDFAEFLGNLFRFQHLRSSPSTSVVFRTPSYSIGNRIVTGTERIVVRIPYRRDTQT